MVFTFTLFISKSVVEYNNQGFKFIRKEQKFLFYSIKIYNNLLVISITFG